MRGGALRPRLLLSGAERGRVPISGPHRREHGSAPTRGLRGGPPAPARPRQVAAAAAPSPAPAVGPAAPAGPCGGAALRRALRRR